MVSDLEAVWHDGRFVTKSTLWWWTRTTILMDELYCVHGKNLNKVCNSCTRGEEWNTDEV